MSDRKECLGGRNTGLGQCGFVAGQGLCTQRLQLISHDLTSQFLLSMFLVYYEMVVKYITFKFYCVLNRVLIEIDREMD